MWATPTSAERGVLDIDAKHDGTATLAALEAEHGTLPLTPKVKTGGGGWHYYFRWPAGTRNGESIAPGIDRRAVGGYVIIPTSQSTIPEHEGRAYAWEVRPWEAAIAEAPAWVVGLKATGKGGGPAATRPGTPSPDADPWVYRPAEDLTTHPGSVARELGGEGRRPVLLRLAGAHLARGDSEDRILALAEAWAGRCTPPMDDWHDHATRVIAKEGAKASAIVSTEPRGGHPLPAPRLTAGE
jgi:hypothetical protein